MPSNQTKTILITGAGQGIGRASVELFSQRGWNVAAMVRSEPQPYKSGEGIIKTFTMDVTKPESVAAGIADAIAAFKRIDVVVNNAGYARGGVFEEQSDAEIRQHFETNLFGAMSVTRTILPHLRANGAGRIINVSSICGRMTLPLLSAYCSTKWALDGFSEALSFELKSIGLKVKIIEPGVIRTKFVSNTMNITRQTKLNAYNEFVDNVLPNLQTWEDSAPEPDVVARSIWTAATDIWPRLRYHPAGLMAIAPRGLVPGNLYVRAVRRIMNAW